MVKSSQDFKNTPTDLNFTSVSLSLPVKLYDRLEEYRWLNKLTRSAAAAELIRMGLVGPKKGTK